jgi:hypothetical protein
MPGSQTFNYMHEMVTNQLSRRRPMPGQQATLMAYNDIYVTYRCSQRYLSRRSCYCARLAAAPPPDIDSRALGPMRYT